MAGVFGSTGAAGVTAAGFGATTGAVVTGAGRTGAGLGAIDTGVVDGRLGIGSEGRVLAAAGAGTAAGLDTVAVLGASTGGAVVVLSESPVPDVGWIAESFDRLRSVERAWLVDRPPGEDLICCRSCLIESASSVLPVRLW